MLALTWLLIVWGATSVITQSRIVRPFRERFEPETLAGDFVRCPQCIGWWVGLGVSLGLGLGLVHLHAQLPFHGLCEALCDAFAASAACAGCSKIEDALKGVASLMIRR